MARLETKYTKEIVPELKKKFGRENVHSIPKLEKITLNMGVGKALDDKAKLEVSVQQMTMIAGQKAIITKSKRAVSAFRLRGDAALVNLLGIESSGGFELALELTTKAFRHGVKIAEIPTTWQTDGGQREALAATLDNDLQRAALSLRPDLQDRLDALTDAGALGADDGRLTGLAVALHESHIAWATYERSL